MSDGVTDSYNVCELCGERMFGHDYVKCHKASVKCLTKMHERIEELEAQVKELTEWKPVDEYNGTPDGCMMAAIADGEIKVPIVELATGFHVETVYGYDDPGEITHFKFIKPPKEQAS